MELAWWARAVAEENLASERPGRWAHVLGVAEQAARVSTCVEADGELLVAAAYLHDVGYAPALVETGLHPLDGARYLRARGAPGRLCSLVAHHSCATFEAEERGLAHLLLAEFPAEHSAVADALTYCDMTTGADGERVTLDHRLADILGRYGTEHVVGRAIARAADCLREAIARTEGRLAAATA